MKLLLDTHIWLWSLLEPERLTRRVRRALVDSNNELWVSPVSTWEVLVLCDKGRVMLGRDPSTWISTTLASVPMKEAPLTHEVALATASVSLPHRDPADRFLVATAKVYGLTLVTSDTDLIGSKSCQVLANR